MGNRSRWLLLSFALWLGLFPLQSGVVAEDPSATSALELIEAGRGGRHWVDAETDPPRSPEETVSSFQIEKGFSISLFAAEPLVRDPVAISFDQRGRMFVAEYSDYPIGPPKGQEPLSKIVLLDDSDNDGKADRRTVFADKLDFAHSMMAYRGGMLVGAKTQILFLKDTDGDDVADVRQVLFDGFKPAHAQMQVGNPRWGLDNRIYFNYGPGEVFNGQTPDQVSKLPRKDFWFDPVRLEYGSDGGLGQFGNTVDRWGERFYCTNRNPIMTTFLSPEQVHRNPFHVVAKTQYDVAKSGGDTRVFPLRKMKSNYLSHAGTHTSACGTTAYLGDLGDESLAQSVFVCEPIGHLVTRSVVYRDGLKMRATRVGEGQDFLASTDSWFRPSSLATGPGGAFYLADMYRLWVEHPKFLPPEIAAKLDWRAGEDRGRIYRIVPTGSDPRPFTAASSAVETVNLLADPNGWRQTLGQRLLVESQAVESENLVRDLLHDPKPTTRLRAMWTLAGLSCLSPADALLLMKDSHPAVRKHAVTLADRWIDQSEVLSSIAQCTNDPDVQVRLRAAMTLTGQESAKAIGLLSKLAAAECEDRSFTEAMLTATKTTSGRIIANLIQDKDFRASGTENRVYLLRGLAAIVGSRGQLSELSHLISLLETETRGGWWRAAIVSGLGDGLPRHRGELGKLTLAKLIDDPPAGLADSTTALRSVFEQNRLIATDPKRDTHSRVTALGVLAFQPFAESETTFASLLGSDQPVELQTASINAITENGSLEASQMILSRWKTLGPSVRATAIEFLLRRTGSTKLALSSMSDGAMSPSFLNVDQRVRLLKHSDEQIRESAIALFGSAVSANRKAVAEQYKSALTLTGSPLEGVKVFKRVCAACHQLDGIGHEAGPSLSDVRKREKAALLYEILDPNSKVEPRFTAYSVLTNDGQLFNGLIGSETEDAIVLKMAKGQGKTIGRSEIDQIKVSNVSLMPEGIEKEVTTQQMADLLAYLNNDPPNSP